MPSYPNVISDAIAPFSEEYNLYREEHPDFKEETGHVFSIVLMEAYLTCESMRKCPGHVAELISHLMFLAWITRQHPGAMEAIYQGTLDVYNSIFKPPAEETEEPTDGPH